MTRNSRKNLEETVDYLKKEIQSWQERLHQARAEARETKEQYRGFLDNLVTLDPSLDRFRYDTIDSWGQPGREWDFGGVKTAVDFRINESLADKFAPHAEQTGPKRGLK